MICKGAAEKGELGDGNEVCHGNVTALVTNVTALVTFSKVFK